MKDDRLYLVHITESIDHILEYTTAGKAAFLSERKTQDAVIRNLQTLAESTQQISAGVKMRHPEVDWTRLAGLRNVLVHQYLGVSVERVWEIIERNLPALRIQVKAILDELGPGS